MDLLEYQGKQLFARHGVPVPDGAPATHRRRGRRRRRRDRLPVRRQGAGADRRPRQGRRHQGRQGRDEAARARRRRSSAWTSRASPSTRSGSRPRRDIAERVLRLDRLRPRGQDAAGHALHAGRHGHRGGRRDATPRRSPRCTSTRCSASRTSTAAGSPSRPASPPTSIRPVGALLRQALRGVRRRGGDARRGQPADRHARPRGRWRSTRRSRSTTTRCSATPTTPRCATRAPRTRRSRWPTSAA